MKNRKIHKAFIPVILLLAPRLALADWEKTESPHRAAVSLARMPSKGVVEAPITPEVFDLARLDLADLRVASKLGGETPYVFRFAKGKTHRTTLPVKLYNRTYRANRRSSVTVDFGSSIMKNRIEVATPGTNFRRKVFIEGSDDGRTWEAVREGAFLFRIASDAARSGYDKKKISLPDNNQRYLRITVFNAPDDPRRIEVQDVKAWRVIKELAETTPVDIAGSSTEQDKKKNETYVYLDLGYCNLPLYELRLNFSDANFFRRISISGRNRKKRTITTPVEDGPPREKVVDEPWAPVTTGAIYRYSSGGAPDEELSLNIKRAAYRYLRITIQNGDNPPLRYTGASVDRLVHRVVFQPKDEGSHFLYFGHPGTGRPSYDLKHYVGRLQAEGVAEAALSESMPNPFYTVKEKTPPWSEKFKWLIWLALLAVLALLGSMVYRQIKTGDGVKLRPGS